MVPAALFGAIYGYWMHYVYALFTFWMPLVFAAAVGIAVGVIAKTNHIRSAGFVAVLGFDCWFCSHLHWLGGLFTRMEQP